MKILCLACGPTVQRAVGDVARDISIDVELTIADSLDGAGESLSDATIDLVFMDLSGCEDTEAVRQTTYAFRRQSPLPLIVLGPTKYPGDGAMISALNVGADEYVRDPSDADELSSKTIALIRRIQR